MNAKASSVGLYMRLGEWIEREMDRYLSGHKRWRVLGFHVVVHGHNAMHFAVHLGVPGRRMYICFHPSVRMRGRLWPWYFYISRNATPWAATFAMGPGVSKANKFKANRRRHLLSVLKSTNYQRGDRDERKST